MFLVYFAGELFSSKHLVGNAALADAIALEAIKELQLLSQSPPVISDELTEPIFRWISKMPGFISSESGEKVMAALTEKKAKRLLP
jgi:hypothetical protein